jgi:hypothetical protein
MKKFTLLSTLTAVLFVTTTFAQPVIVDGTNLPPVGYTTSIMNGTASTGPGAGGASATWNLGTLSLSNVGTYAVVNPATTPVAASYPSGNYAISVTPTSGSALYSYYIKTAGDLSELCNSVTTTAGSGVNYTPGPRKILKFPFNYNDTFTAVYATTASPGNDFESYDGYGTLITPWATYTNVVRIKTTYTSSVGYAINWYTLNPLLSVLTYDSNSNSYTGLTVSPTETEQVTPPNSAVSVFPNPFTNNMVVKLSSGTAIDHAAIVITDVTGRIVKQVAIANNETTIRRDKLGSGIYFYQVVNSGVSIAEGKLIIQ